MFKWLMLLVLGCGVFFYFKGAALIRLRTGDNFPVFMFAVKSHVVTYPLEDIPNNWQSRVVSMSITGWLLDRVHPRKIGGFMDLFAAYNTAWVLAIFGMVCLFCARPVEIMTGIMAGLMCSQVPEVNFYVMPWDMPVMFFWFAAYLLYLNIYKIPGRSGAIKWRWMALISLILLGALFKETVLVCALYLLALPMGWFKRLGLIGGVVLLGLALEKIVSPAGTQSDWMYSVQHFVANVSMGRVLHLWPALLAGGGAVILLARDFWRHFMGDEAAATSLPDTRRLDWPFYAVMFSFIFLQALNNMAFGIYCELRDWDELIPIAWVTAFRPMLAASVKMAS